MINKSNMLNKILYILSFLYFPSIAEKYTLFKRRIYSVYVGRKLKNKECNILFGVNCKVIGHEYIEIGHSTIIDQNSVITAFNINRTPSLTIKDNVRIGSDAHITCINSVYIGSHVLTGRKITITDNSHGDTDLSTLQQHPIERAMVSKGPVIIEDDVWIGDKATILPNVTIGRGSIIAANSVVTKSVPPFSIVAGCPSKIIKQLQQD